MSSGYFFVDNKELDRSIKDLQRQLRKSIGKNLSSKVIQDVFLEKANIFRYAEMKEAPKSKKPHKIYYKSKAKSSKNGKRAVTVQPGNLRKSITVFPGNNLAVYIGPRRKNAKHGNKKADGFYGYWVNYGLGNQTRAAQFIQKAYASKSPLVARTIIDRLQRKVKKINLEVNGTSS